MADLLDSDGPDYDPEALLEAADLDRKARRERGEQVGPIWTPEPEETRCKGRFGTFGRYGTVYRCILPDGHTGGHHYQGKAETP